ncbi:MAG: hypothetical protein WCG37_04380 [Actinomycetes bacterium]
MANRIFFRRVQSPADISDSFIAARSGRVATNNRFGVILRRSDAARDISEDSWVCGKS